jgi:hypothetical protein
VVVSSIDECYDGEGPDGISAQHGGWVAAEDVCELAGDFLCAVCG